MQRQGVSRDPVLADAGYGVVTAWREQSTRQGLRYVVGVTMPLDTPIAQLVRLAMMRRRIERGYQELKGEFGLDHYEERGWRGFHHHRTLRPERHVPVSITTMLRSHTRLLLKRHACLW